MFIYKSASYAAKILGSGSSVIAGICNGRKSSWEGLHFKYLEDIK